MSGTDGISFLDKDELGKHINIIMSQTNYTEEEAIQKLNYNHLIMII